MTRRNRSRAQLGFAAPLVLLGTIILAAFVGGTYYFSKTKPLKPINSYEDCIKAGYPVMMSYPSVCKTPDGRMFTQQISESEKSTLTSPSPDSTKNWKVFRPEPEETYFSLASFKYPSDWVVGFSAEGCGVGRYFGPKARPNPDGVLVYPRVTLCLYNYGTFNEAVEEGISSRRKYRYADIISVTKGEVDGHRFVKLRTNPKPQDGRIYTVYFDSKPKNPPPPPDVPFPVGAVYVYYAQDSYAKYGARQDFAVDQLISTIDQIVSTFKFTD